MSDILRVLVYFDLFDYPLTEQEVQRFIQEDPSDQQFQDALGLLVESTIVFSLDGFYALRNDRMLSIARVQKNEQAAALLKIAQRTSRFLYGFPFVRGVFISGSLSKNAADDDGDIDYFIITSSGRLWIARSLMHLFKKFSFLTGKQHWYCMNYFVDERALEIKEKNIYTAMELVTLLHFQGKGVAADLRKANGWTKDYFPNAHLHHEIEACSQVSLRVKRMLECMLNNRLIDRLDDYLMDITAARWARNEKAGKLNVKGARMGISTGKHFCKPTPHLFQDELLGRYHLKLGALRRQYGFD